MKGGTILCFRQHSKKLDPSSGLGKRIVESLRSSTKHYLVEINLTISFAWEGGDIIQWNMNSRTGNIQTRGKHVI
jgi:hypothetical protein